MDVQELIDDWDRIRTTVPSTEDVNTAFAGSRTVAEIHLMSRRREVWEAFVCLISFCEVEGSNPNDVLQEIQSGIFDVDAQPSPVARAFVAYSTQYMTVGKKEFLSGALKVKTLFTDQLIMIRSSTLDKLQECRAAHEPDWDKVWRCVRAGGGQSAKSAAG